VLKCLRNYLQAMVSEAGVIQNQPLHPLIHTLDRVKDDPELISGHVELVPIHSLYDIQVEADAVTQPDDLLIDCLLRYCKLPHRLDVGVCELRDHIMDN